MEGMMKNQVMPKAKMVTGLIGDILGVPPTHPAVSRSTVSIVGPCIFLLVANPDWQKKIFPTLLTDTEALVDRMVTFALSGLRAVAAVCARRRVRVADKQAPGCVVVLMHYYAPDLGVPKCDLPTNRQSTRTTGEPALE